MSDDLDTKKKTRSFKIKIGEEKAYGRYTGDSPYQAANKALSELIRKKKNDGSSVSGKINFTLSKKILSPALILKTRSK